MKTFVLQITLSRNGPTIMHPHRPEKFVVQSHRNLTTVSVPENSIFAFVFSKSSICLDKIQFLAMNFPLFSVHQLDNYIIVTMW